MSKRAVSLAILSALSAGCFATSAATNIDPAGDGSRYAYAENVGWIDAKPLGDAGPGVVVADFELTGWMWSENAGWIVLSCKDRASCAASPWGVRNDGAGVLSGRAWSENGGWIDFGPSTAGVTIDPATGVFAGCAWSENLGWISFASSAPFAFHVVTGWRCSPTPPAPVGSPVLAIDKSGDAARLAWSGPAAATGFDAVRGDLGVLRLTGSFAGATERCLADDSTLGGVLDTDTPDAEGGFWYLVRGVNCGGPGTYDGGEPSQQGSRDLGISESTDRCP